MGPGLDRLHGRERAGAAGDAEGDHLGELDVHRERLVRELRACCGTVVGNLVRRNNSKEGKE